MAAASPPTFRVFRNVRRPSDDLITPFRGAPTGNVCDAMDRFGAMDHRIRALDPGLRLCGPALTVRTRPGDNIAIYKALEETQPGDVLVIATYEYLVGSTFGGLWFQSAKNAGVAGVVCDGLCRDLSEIRSFGLPCFVRGTSPSSPFKHGPAEIGGAVSCGGAAVHTGDLVCGDEDGVVVVPQGDLARVADALAARVREGGWAWMYSSADTAEREPALQEAARLGLGGDVVRARLERATGYVARRLVDEGVASRVVVAGGETTGAVAEALALGALEVGPALDPGVPVMRSLDGPPVRLVFKSGNFGSPDFFLKALRHFGVEPGVVAHA